MAFILLRNYTMRFRSKHLIYVGLLAALAASIDDDGSGSVDDEEEEGGTPIYDWSHHRWGSNETLTSSFLLVFMGLFGFAVVSSYYMGHVVHCTLFPEVPLLLFGLRSHCQADL